MRKTNNKFLGVIGGGQLGRMFAEAAKSLGYKVIVLEPNKNCPASQFADELICADYSNNDALINMSSKCFAVTAYRPTISPIRNFRPIGKVTTNAAPRKEPNIEPSPPIIIINKTGNEIVIISKDSVTSIAPKKTAKYNAPAPPM